MEINVTVKNVKTNKEYSGVLPINLEFLNKTIGTADSDEKSYIFLDSTEKLIGENDGLKCANAFAEKVEDVEDNLVKAVYEVTGYKAKYFVIYDFSFEDCSLLPDVHTQRELGEYYFDELGADGVGKENLEWYFDHEAYGRDIALESFGGFSDYGYVEIN